jgi:chorismate synthase
MSGNSFGQCFRVTTFGESHGGAVGAIVDGCPAGLVVDVAAIQAELDRRRPGQSALTSPRQEADVVQIMSGISDGIALGTPISMWVHNTDARPADYAPTATIYRPSHADFTTQAKYGRRAPSGGGRASARETVGRVAAGAVAKALLQQLHGVEVLAFVSQVHRVVADLDPLDSAWAARLQRSDIEANSLRCPDPVAALRMQACIEQAKQAGDSVGGVLVGLARGLPAGWGEPVFDKLEAELGRAILSIPACRGFEVGSGFASTRLYGSEHNDAFVERDGQVHTQTNRSGGIQGGISNGEPLVVRAAFKPTASIGRPQASLTESLEPAVLRSKGRHDPCVLPRAVPIVEAMISLVLADHCLRQRGQNG